jgi:hypothetical protein
MNLLNLSIASKHMKQDEMLKGIVHGLGKREIDTKSWSAHLEEGEQLEHLGVDGRIILKWILKREDIKYWTSFIRLQAETIGTHLWVQQ